MKKYKNYAFIILAFVFSLSFVKASFAGEWVADGEYKLYNEGGSFVVNDWKEIDKVNYYFDAQGHMATSLIKIGKRYFLFHINGLPYKQDEKVILAGKEYTIGARGRVLDLDGDIDDTTYFKILAELKAHKAEEEAFLATSFNSPDLVPEEATIAPEEKMEPGMMTEQEQRLLAADAYNQKLKDQAAAEALAAKYRILSLEYRNELKNTATTAGGDPGDTANILMLVFVGQLNTIKTNHCNSILAIMQTAPETLNIDAFIDEYSKTIKEYEPEIDVACDIVKARYTLDNTSFVLMKDKFTTLLKEEKRAFRNQIMDLVR